jgi:diaminopimelate epimerase
MQNLHFQKMNGAGNDFIMLDNRKDHLLLSGSEIARLCHRHRGIGADGLILVEQSTDKKGLRMRYYNADGAEAEMCGNGARCFARYAERLVPSTDQKICFETAVGPISASLATDEISLRMSQPDPFTEGVELAVAGQTLTVYSINTGVPHAVALVDDLKATDVGQLGAALRHHPHFQPRGTNVNFAQELGPQKLAIRTYERGVEGETLACGTGVVACALTWAAVTGAASPIRVLVQGGDTLKVAFASTAEGFREVILTGPADFVFEGEITV